MNTSTPPTISVIVATDLKGAIGNENKLLWHLPADMKFFKEKTMGHHIVMGRKTYESIGRPLPGRTTIIVTRNKAYKADGCIVVHSLEEAIQYARANKEEEVMIVGGSELYSLAESFATTLYLTLVKTTLPADVFFSYDLSNWTLVKDVKGTVDEKNSLDHQFLEYQKINVKF